MDLNYYKKSLNFIFDHLLLNTDQRLFSTAIVRSKEMNHVHFLVPLN